MRNIRSISLGFESLRSLSLPWVERRFEATQFDHTSLLELLNRQVAVRPAWPTKQQQGPIALEASLSKRNYVPDTLGRIGANS